MIANGYLQLAFYIVVLIALAKPVGAYMARIYSDEPAVLKLAFPDDEGEHEALGLQRLGGEAGIGLQQVLVGGDGAAQLAGRCGHGGVPPRSVPSIVRGPGGPGQ